MVCHFANKGALHSTQQIYMEGERRDTSALCCHEIWDDHQSQILFSRLWDPAQVSRNNVSSYSAALSWLSPMSCAFRLLVRLW